MKSRETPKKFSKMRAYPLGHPRLLENEEAYLFHPLDGDNYYDVVHKSLAGLAAHTILYGLFAGKVPIKVCWLSTDSNEPLGMFYSGAKEAYRGILIRYEAGTNGRRYCSFMPPHPDLYNGDVLTTIFGKVPFDEAKDLSNYADEGKGISDLVEVLLRSTQPDIDIAIPELVEILKGATR